MFLLKRFNIPKLILNFNIPFRRIQLMEVSNHQVSEKLVAFRKFLSEHNIDAYVIPHSDPHQVKKFEIS